MAEKINEKQEQNAGEMRREKVRIIPIREIDDFPDHPFHIKDDDEMERLMESVSEYGVITPVVVRKKEDGRYELVSGHRRKYASEKLGITHITAIVREMSREEAVIMMVDSNLQREHVLPSEKAFAYKMRLEAMRRQGYRSDLTSAQLGQKFLSVEKLAEKSLDSRVQIQRYIRLTYLEKPLLALVDEGKIAITPAVEISYLSEKEQRELLETIQSEESTPSLSQAIQMKKLSAEGKLTMDEIFNIMTQEKANQKEKLKIPMERVGKYFKRGTPPGIIEELIIKLLDEYFRKKSLEDRGER